MSLSKGNNILARRWRSYRKSVPIRSPEQVIFQRMSSQAAVTQPARSASRWSSDVAILIYVALATVVVHLLTGGRYGFHRDELATLDDARHLAWGT